MSRTSAAASRAPSIVGVSVTATASAEADATSQAYGGALLGDGGAARATTTVTPRVQALVGSGAVVTAAGDATVSAGLIRQGEAPSSDIVTVDADEDTISLDLRLLDGQIVRYVAGADPVTSGGSALPGSRELSIVVVDDGVYRLGVRFTGASIDPFADVIRFGVRRVEQGELPHVDDPGAEQGGGLMDDQRNAQARVEARDVELHLELPAHAADRRPAGRSSEHRRHQGSDRLARRRQRDRLAVPPEVRDPER